MPEYLVGVDVGSASVRAGVYDNKGNCLAVSVSPIKQFRPKPNFVEQSSDDIWIQTCKVVKNAIKDSGVHVSQVKGIGFDATCSLVALDEMGQPVSVSPTGINDQNIIMWMDHRAIEQAEKINASNDSNLKYVGGEISPEMEIPKIAWIKQNLPTQYSKIASFFDLADFLVHKATNQNTRSVCTKTCKWNYLAHKKEWAKSVLEVAGLNDLVSSGKIDGEIADLGTAAGQLSGQCAELMGLTSDVVVATGIIDAHAGGLAIIGSKPETTLAIIGGTSSCHMAVSKVSTFVPGVWGPYWGAMLPDYWLLEGGQSAAGALVDHVIRTSSVYPALKQRAEVEGKTVYNIINDRLLVLEQGGEITSEFHLLGYYHGNRSPRANPNLKGMISGLTLNDSLDELVIHYLSAIQSVAYGTRHIIDTMVEHGHQINEIHMCGGGTKNPIWLREHADICQCDVVLPKEVNAVLLGSAMLAASASDTYPTLFDAIGSMYAEGDRIQPNAERSTFHDKKYQVFLEMYHDQMKYKSIMGNQ
ncbi:FGGY-family carbohydrate kinase [Photobacterium sp. DNB23_23_1]